jgi:diguanylate cyclase (GGDEF)-like protein/PAS domain S-box-containing protein
MKVLPRRLSVARETAATRDLKLRATLKALPLANACMFLNLVFFLLVFFPERQGLTFYLICGANAFCSSLAIVLSLLDLRRKDLSSPSFLLKHLFLCSSIAVSFGALLLYLFPGTSGMPLLFLSVAGIATIAIGGFATSTQPAISATWILLTGTAFMSSLPQARGLDAYLLCAYFCVFVGIFFYLTYRYYLTYRERFEAVAKVEEQMDVITLLLRDFENDAGDWLWETDQKGRLTYASPRLEVVLGIPRAQVLGKEAMKLILQTFPITPDGAELELQELARFSRDRLPFRDFGMRLWVGGQQRWWILSGKPMFKDGAHVGWRGVGRDVTEKRRYELEMERQANRDPLTGLANRFYLSQSYEKHLAKGEKAADPALVLIDLDNFAKLNAVLGHEAGDLILRGVAERVKNFASMLGGTAARLGSDDFAIALKYSGDHLEEAVAGFLRLLHEPMRIGDDGIEIRSWAGIARGLGRGDSFDGVFKRAEMALESAKDEGPLSVKVYDSEVEERTIRKVGLINDLQGALSRGELSLAYQPQVDASTKLPIAVETLVRWDNPRWGSVSPSEFIPLAEQSGQIVSIGAWILRKACEDALEWGLPWKVAVNVSAGQFLGKDFIPMVIGVLEATGLPPRRLKLEITESAFIGDSARVRTLLENLRALGISISLDDFGTGYSSLSYLRAFPLDELKIDQSFVSAMESDSVSVAIIDTILRLASSLELATTAEGVETEAQARILGALGCKRYQGFLYAKPMSQGELRVYQSRYGGADEAAEA